ncbi:MAG: CsbD family protein [Oceanicaulis sp.]|nr:CsbD family protein [Oceanicaulis sp.]
MNWDIVKGKWKQITGSAKSQWGKLTEDELQQIDGDREALIGKIQEKYGVARDEAEKEVDEWAKGA